MSDTLRLLDDALLAPLIEAAAASPRRRRNLNLHADLAAPCQRFFNAMEPDSYVRPHRHREAGREETLIVVRGSVAVLTFDETGAVRSVARLRPGGEAFGVHVPLGVWHGLVALEPGTVFLEAKGGPYTPTAPDDFASWAPSEGEPEVAQYLERMRGMVKM